MIANAAPTPKAVALALLPALAFSHFALINSARAITLATRRPGTSPVDAVDQPV